MRKICKKRFEILQHNKTKKLINCIFLPLFRVIKVEPQVSDPEKSRIIKHWILNLSDDDKGNKKKVIQAKFTVVVKSEKQKKKSEKDEGQQKIYSINFRPNSWVRVLVISSSQAAIKNHKNIEHKR